MITQIQKSVLFWVFVGAFLILTGLAIWDLFFQLENLDDSYRDKLFLFLILEIVGGVIFLFNKAFGLKGNTVKSKKIWIDFDDEVDAKKFIGVDVQISPRSEDGNPICDEITNKVLKDRGLYVSPELPINTKNVFLTIVLVDEIYEGSFPVESFVVKLEEQEL